MASNSSRGNPIGARDGPKTSTGAEVPPISEDTKQDVTETSGAEATGEHVPGQDPSAEGTEEAATVEATPAEGEEGATKSSKKKH
ncbi:hypothetical protein B0T21DRAFT_370521 [Apiosordaria backusii]|uniref:Uncharacterized protein n=1 Tax=Apiosordaria backusii TaxID=314023 RepID=A0AA40B7Q3_9PEZI|nr:hypothetical protein B0T21DRAFT_370521 [Apiosordaria backusii]